MGEREPVRVLLHPRARGEDDGQGGIRRVLEGMQRHLPAFGIELVDTPEEAEIIACHIDFPAEWVQLYPDRMFVLHCHGLYWTEYEWPRWALEANERVLEAIRVADAVTVPSEWVGAIVRRQTCRAPLVVPHGLDLEDYVPADPLGYVLWDKTRVDPVCDPTPAIEAARLLPSVPFILTAGEAAGLENVAVTTDRTGGKPLPWEEARLLTQQAGVYLATTRETFGIATLQALAYGVPVVGYAWGANLDILRPGKDSYLVHPGDVDALAHAITLALTDRERMSEEARATAARYGWHDSIALYAQLYQTLAARRRRRASADAAPRTSIVVRVRDLAQYLPHALESVVQQTDPDWECVVVDDASTDDSAAIADQWAAGDGRFRVVRNGAQLGVSGALDAGIAAAKGRFVMALDADDMLATTAIATLAEALERDRHLAVVYGGVHFVGEDGRTPMEYGGQPGHSGWPFEFVYQHQVTGHNLVPYCAMFRREAAAATGGHRRRLQAAEDADFWTRLASYGYRIKMVTSAVTLTYRVRQGSVSNTRPVPEWWKWFPAHRDIRKAPAGCGQTGVPLPLPSLTPPALSVVIPVGANHTALVTDAVDSVEAQSYQGWECIVVNDSGSPLPWMPAWVKRVDTPRLGVAAARNAGAAVASGRALLFLDADDILERDALALLVGAAKEAPNDIVYGDFWEDPTAAGSYQLFRCPEWSCHEVLEHSVHPVTALIPRHVFDQLGGFPVDTAWEDWALQIEAAVQGICSQRIPRPIFTYRKHTGHRRDENYRDFDASKASILARYADYFHGRKQLAGCTSCGGRRAAPVAGPGGAAQQQGGEGMLVQYIGTTEGERRFRGGTTRRDYWFSAGDIRYVDERDAPGLLARVDFQEANVAEAEAAVEPSGEGPQLTSTQVASSAAATATPVLVSAPPAPAPPVAAPVTPDPPAPPPAPEEPEDDADDADILDRAAAGPLNMPEATEPAAEGASVSRETPAAATAEDRLIVSDNGVRPGEEEDTVKPRLAPRGVRKPATAATKPRPKRAKAPVKTP